VDALIEQAVMRLAGGLQLLARLSRIEPLIANGSWHGGNTLHIGHVQRMSNIRVKTHAHNVEL
jgi:hypothetical protein